MNELNPFQELYVTETARPDEFVKLFSPFLVEHALMLFQQGNVVLRGTQGSGKSMLLNLLKPEIRQSYYKHSLNFPVPEELSRFIGAGINLTKSGATNIGQRPLSKDISRDKELFPLYFADFVNYYILRDVLKSLKFILDNSELFPNFFANHVKNDEALKMFSSLLAKQDCFFNFLHGVNNFVELCSRVDERLAVYRRFQQFNISELPENVQTTKTEIGQPVSQTAKCLWESGLLSREVKLFIKIDQYEILGESDSFRSDLGAAYRRTINKALSTRDSHISYRLGTRHYAWKEDATVYGTSSTLEHLRDYRIIDIDELLRRKEDRSSWIFPDFAKDVFERRLLQVNIGNGEKNVLRKVLGRSKKPREAAIYYSGNSKAERVLDIQEFPAQWQKFLTELFYKDPLSAKLAEAWLRQRGNSSGKMDRALQEVPLANYPWESKYWKKERVRQALMQISARSGQRLEWSGEDSVIALSMGSILVFVSICQHIWDVFMRTQRGLAESEHIDPLKGIAPKTQAVAIQTCSKYWYQKISELPGGSDRQRFIDHLGRIFESKLKNDKSMSYPGHNGFSVVKNEIEQDTEIYDFLKGAVDYANLYSVDHTTRYKDRKHRIKWYLNPILSPYYGLPDSHVKEPMYVHASDVRDWLIITEILESNNDLCVDLDRPIKSKRMLDTDQKKLFDF